MITRIEINGFKSFHSFAVDLRPFQVFIGPNGVGKTNLFDAITLLANLAADRPLTEAFEQSRGEIGELFTNYNDGTNAKMMSFAVEVLIDKTSTEGGKTREVASTRLRYELDIEHKVEKGVEQLRVVNEGLLPIVEANDKWAKDNLPSKTRKNWVVREKRPPYIATVEDDKGEITIFRNQDAPGGGREALNVADLDRTVLGSANAQRYPTIHAMRQDMQNWRFLQLNPVALRLRSGSQGSATLLPDGSNMAAVIARLSRNNGKAKGTAGIVDDMKKLIPDIRNLTIKPIEGRDEFLIEVETQDGSKFSSRVLSDGTLRLLALVTLKNDPLHRGVLCFEEPENGVQPHRLKQIVDVLYGLSTNFNSDDANAPLRQVLINTHSPGLLANVPSDSLYYVGMKGLPKGKGTHVVPVRASLFGDEDEKFYTWEQVKQYLDSAPLDKKREEFGL
jgi:predicted ATPase